jgi:predicted DNA-binding transcriptional regulator AlpA
MHPRRYQLMRDGLCDPERDTYKAIPPPRSGYEPQSARGPPLDEDVLLTAAQTRARVGGVSAMCIWRWMRDPRVQFPTPVKINGRNYWRRGDLRRWQAERVGPRHNDALPVTEPPPGR